MATLRTIRRRITAVQNTAKITQAMRMISAAQLKRAQNNIESARPYVLKLENVLTNLISVVGEDYSHSLIEQRSEVKSVAIITVASDRGLCGSFNHSLFRFVTNYIDTDLKVKYPDAKFFHIPVGKRTVQFFTKSGADIIKSYAGIFSKLNFSIAQDIVNLNKQAFIDKKIDKVIVIFNEFKNILVQKPKIISLIPIESDIKENIPQNTNVNLDYIFEPEQKKILDELLPKYVDIQLWRALLESFASEQAARMVAMENATNNAHDLIKHLELVFNKARQAAITKEMLEIVSGAEALKK